MGESQTRVTLSAVQMVCRVRGYTVYKSSSKLGLRYNVSIHNCETNSIPIPISA